MNFEIAPKSTEIEANWDDARLYCFSLNIDGKIGWRLPTKDELNEIHKSKNDFEKWYHWSSNEFDDNCAWVQKFGKKGNQYDIDKNYGDGYVRAVRSI